MKTPFYARKLPDPGAEHRARRFAEWIRFLPPHERRWRLVDFNTQFQRADLTLRVEFLAGLMPKQLRQRGGQDRW